MVPWADRSVLAPWVECSKDPGPEGAGVRRAAGLSDFVILGQQRGRMFMRSPYVIPEIMSGEVDEDTLGGATHHASRSGVACMVSESESGAFDIAAEILSFLPDHTMAEPPRLSTGDKWKRKCKGMGKLVPLDSDRPYDMRGVIAEVVDDKRFLELFPSYAENVVVGFARLDGVPVGVVGNQPSVLAGCLDIDASVKAARFIRTCDCFNIPIVTFVDVPGFLPGTVQEWGGIIRHGAKLLYAYAEATVPKLAVVTRKAYGGAYLAMSCKHLGSDYNVAWPTGELAVMGAEGAVRIIHRAELEDSDNLLAETYTNYENAVMESKIHKREKQEAREIAENYSLSNNKLRNELAEGSAPKNLYIHEIETIFADSGELHLVADDNKNIVFNCSNLVQDLAIINDLVIKEAKKELSNNIQEIKSLTKDI